jgi:SnoaL-like protein
VSVTETSATAVAMRFLDALGRRDYDALARCFHTDARMRALVPSRLREEEGADAIAERYRAWVGRYDSYKLVDPIVDELVDLVRLRYAVRGVDPEVGHATIFEQTAYAEVSDGAIAELRLVCSGERPL